MKKVLSSVFLGALLTIGALITASAADADPVIGTWKLNLAASTFAGIPAVKSEIRIYSRAARGLALTIKAVSAEGKETTTNATYQLDGKDFSSMGNPNFDSLSGLQVDANTAEFTLKRAGEAVGKIRRAVSKDGRTLTINYLLKNSDGVQTSARTVYDKQ